jgi:hypothetical protein
MNTRVDIEDIEATRSEKLLVVLLALFLLVGTVWFYAQVPSWVDDALPQVSDSAVVQAERKESAADDERWRLESERDESRAQLDLAREEYKVALSEGRAVESARQRYDQAHGRMTWSTPS